MKKYGLFLTTLLLATVLLLTACSGPFGMTSPSVHNPTTQTGEEPNKAEDYAGLIALVQKAQNSNSPFSRRYYMKGGIGAPEAVADQNTADGNNRDQHSTTNIQVEGVDEADIIKTDGNYLYLVANNRLYIVDAGDPAGMRVVSIQTFNTFVETDKTIVNEYPVEMYLDIENSRLILIMSGSISEKYIPEEPKPEETKPEETKPEETKPDETKPDPVAPDQPQTSAGSAEGGSGGETGEAVEPAAQASDLPAEVSSGAMIAADRIWYPYYNSRSYTTTRIYDISDRANPVVVRQFTQDGYYTTSRRIGGALYVVTNRYDYRIYDATNKDLVLTDVFPSVCEEIGTTEWQAIPAGRITILPDGDIGTQLILAGIDTLDDGRKADVLSVLGSSGSVYASPGFLYVAAWAYQWDGKENSQPVYSTDLYRFKLADSKISEAGKGSVPGSIINQFSMDEHNGYFRIATTTGETWNSANPSKNNLYVLDGSLNIVGKVTGLAPGESIKSVRFMGDQAYVVTFRTVDPLFVIDLTNPRLPVVRGELKIPGYSTYLHPYDENLLIGFGYDVIVEGERVFNAGMKVSLFDISDFDNPREISTIQLGGIGSYGDILYNHKSLLFSKARALIAFPAQLTQRLVKQPSAYTDIVFQGLIVLTVDADNQLVLRGSVTHFDKLSDPNGSPKKLTDKEYTALYGYDAVYRGAYIGDVLYTLSGRQIRATNLADLTPLGQVELPGYADAYQNNGIYRDGVVSQKAD
jgi:uncharacterized secreted protein with C-terminal beta-propeller domain